MDIRAVLKAHSMLFQYAAPLLFHLIGLAIAVGIDSYLSKKHRRIMILVIVAVALLIVQDYAEYRLVVGTPHIFIRTCVAIAGYCIRPIVLALFIAIVDPKRKHLFAWVLIGLNAAVYLTALFSPICFWIDSDNRYLGGPLRFFCLYVSLLLLARLLYLTLRQYGRERKREIWMPLFVTLLILGACGMDFFSSKDTQPVQYLTIAVVTACVCFYIWLHLQFVREHEQALRAEQRIQIMMTQIQPHFVNNTLATIQALCRVDPEKAFDTTAKFGAYLRRNIDALTQARLIPLEKEIEHTKIYTEIETIRFPQITVVYDLRDVGFLLPPLTIQPLVENAIRHGVRCRKNGRVNVSTDCQNGAHRIVIADNGTGFDPKAAPGEGMHIGIRNVRERIEQMCGGTLTVESRMGEGTTVTIQIPGKDRGKA